MQGCTKPLEAQKEEDLTVSHSLVLLWSHQEGGGLTWMGFLPLCRTLSPGDHQPPAIPKPSRAVRTGCHLGTMIRCWNLPILLETPPISPLQPTTGCCLLQAEVEKGSLSEKHFDSRKQLSHQRRTSCSSTTSCCILPAEQRPWGCCHPPARPSICSHCWRFIDE